MKRHLWLAVNSIVVLACLLALWQIAVLMLHVPKYMLPGPMMVGAAMVNRFQALLQSFLITAEAAALGQIGRAHV